MHASLRLLTLFACALVLLGTSTVSAQSLDRAAAVETALQYAARQVPGGVRVRGGEPAFSVTDVTSSSRSGATYVYLRQRLNGVEVQGAELTVVMGRDGQVVSTAGHLVEADAVRVPPAVPAVQPEGAVRAAAQHVGVAVGSLTREAARGGDDAVWTAYEHRVNFAAASEHDVQPDARLVYLAQDEQAGLTGALQLAWAVLVPDPSGEHLWYVHIDAGSGAELRRTDLVVHDHWPNGPLAGGSADVAGVPSWLFREEVRSSVDVSGSMAPSTYRVFPMPTESPAHGPYTLVSNVHNPTASPQGWHSDGTNSYTITRGNNAYAYTDTDANNLPDANSSPDGGASLVFDFAFNPFGTIAANRSAAVTNMFYWNNVIHDVMYQYGFDEVSGNFQAVNFSGDGRGRDAVNAESSDGLGRNNANFSTPPDGQPGRMQMYLFDPGVVASVIAPASIAGDYAAGRSTTFGPQQYDVTGNVVAALPAEGCSALTNAAAIAGRIALINRGTCNFAVKALNAQNANALGVIIVNNAGGLAAPGMSGVDPTITIPTLQVSTVSGTQLRNVLAVEPVTVRLYSLPYDRDASLDNGIMTHEYGHGISNRLTGGPSTTACLGNAEQMGEGWSDFYGLMLTMRSGDTRTQNRGVGQYAQSQPTTGIGFRLVPYTTSFAANNYTYNRIRANGGVHDVGTVWATMLWELTWDLIDQFGFSADLYNANGTAGNQIALNLVTEGLRGQPCNPGFVDGRDAILRADAILYGAAHRNLIWAAFARRGLGFSAVQGSSASVTDNTEAFDMPPGPAAAAAGAAAPVVGVVENGSTTFEVTVQNTATAPAQPLQYTATLDGPAAATEYTWASSDQPGGPAHQFTDISTTGTPLTLAPNNTYPASDEGYAFVTLPFAFPFHGTTQSQVQVSSNGVLMFSTATPNLAGNTPFPANDAGNGLIAPFWDDLDLGATGQVYTLATASTLTIQYTNAGQFESPGSDLTFQVVLHDDGDIDFHYGTMTGDLLSSTVGVESLDGLRGTEVTYLDPFVHSGLTVAFTYAPLWYALASPAQGAVAAASSSTITVAANAQSLAPGTYTVTLTLATSAPTAPTVTIPLTLQVGRDEPTLSGNAGWRFLAPPTTGMTVADLAAQNLVQGIPGYYPTFGTNLFTREAGGWTPPTGGSQPLPSGRGVLWYIYGTATSIPGGPSQGVALPMNLDATGQEPTGNVAVPLFSDGDRWNLVGNPYLTGLDLTTLPTWASGGSLTGVIGQVWDPNAGSTGSYILTSTMGDRLAPWQGVFVENGTATTLTIPASAKVTGGVFHRTGEAPNRLLAFELAGSMADGQPVLDRALTLAFREDATETWDIYDAAKLMPLAGAYVVGAFEGVRDGEPTLTAQASRPLDPASFEVPLHVEAVGVEPTLTLSWPSLDGVPSTWRLTLRDLETGATVDLRAADRYTFSTAPTAARGAAALGVPTAQTLGYRSGARFVVQVETGVATGTQNGGMPTAFALHAAFPNPSAERAMLRYDLPQATDVAIEVFDVTGRRVAVLAEGALDAGRHTAVMESGTLASGVYVVRMRAGQFVAAQRVTVTR